MAKTELSVAIAGGAIAVALIDNLVRQNLLTPETGAILTDAQARLQPFLTSPDAVEAARIISGLFTGLAEDGAIPSI